MRERRETISPTVYGCPGAGFGEGAAVGGGEGVAIGVGVAVVVGDGAMVGEGDTAAVGVVAAPGVGDGAGEGAGVGEGEGLGLGNGVIVGVGVGLRVGVGVAVEPVSATGSAKESVLAPGKPLPSGSEEAPASEWGPPDRANLGRLFLWPGMWVQELPADPY